MPDVAIALTQIRRKLSDNIKAGENCWAVVCQQGKQEGAEHLALDRASVEGDFGRAVDPVACCLRSPGSSYIGGSVLVCPL